LNGYIFDSPFAPDDNHRFSGFSETFLVRGEGGEIPEPQAWLLIGSGLAGLALLSRRRSLLARSTRR
ncbi:MAG: PEP-CTERM sorting domain-containing protein, partial [Bryobacteraceae bacterium]